MYKKTQTQSLMLSDVKHATSDREIFYELAFETILISLPNFPLSELGEPIEYRHETYSIHGIKLHVVFIEIPHFSAFSRTVCRDHCQSRHQIHCLQHCNFGKMVFSFMHVIS
jgi:hypothetical protein